MRAAEPPEAGEEMKLIRSADRTGEWLLIPTISVWRTPWVFEISVLWLCGYIGLRW